MSTITVNNKRRPPSNYAYSNLNDRDSTSSTTINRWKRIYRYLRYRKFSVFVTLATLAIVVYIYCNGFPKQRQLFIDQSMDRKGLTIKGDQFHLNGRPFQILSGSIHYFRVPRAYWRDRLAKLKASGLNTVDTYVAWNMHEEQQGHVDFTGELDIGEFISIAHKLGLYVILRPGPYICAEWDWGGLPPWLLANDPRMHVRSLDESFTKPVEQFFTQLFQHVARLQYSNGGPIIAVQIENEYGAYHDDKNYLLWLLELWKEKLGVTEFLFTSDGPEDFQRGYTPGVFETVNFNEHTEKGLNALEKFQPGEPLMIGEFWPGWFDHWSERHHILPPHDLIRRLEPAFKRGASINFYMFHGGTNFGFMNGANLNYPGDKGMIGKLWDHLSSIIWTSSNSGQFGYYRPTVTSYDYDAPLNEYGGKTKKFEALHDLIDRFRDQTEREEAPTAVNKAPADPWSTWRPPIAYWDANLLDFVTLTDALDSIDPLPVDLEKPIFVETIRTTGAHKLYHGFVAYRTIVRGENVKKIVVDGVLADRMTVILDGVTISTIHSDLHLKPINRELDVASIVAKQTGDDGSNKKATHDLILLVENMGRVNYAKTPRKLNGMFKGFNGTIHVESADGSIKMEKWTIYPLQFRKAAELQALVKSIETKSLWKKVSVDEKFNEPRLYRAEFDTKGTEEAAGEGKFPQDTFVSTKDWGKGVIYANGINLGRYWHVGPQQSLYLPGPWLRRGKNELLIFELESPITSIKFRAEPDLGTPCPLPCYN